MKYKKKKKKKLLNNLFRTNYQIIRHVLKFHYFSGNIKT